MKSRFLGFLTLFLLSLFSLHFARSVFQKNTISKNVYFTSIPMETTGGKPKFAALINGLEVSAELDLGFQGDISFEDALFEALEQKTFLRTAIYHGIKNYSYSTDIFTIPSIQIANITFYKPRAESRSTDFSKNSVLIAGEDSDERPQITFGWELFYNANLLLDFQRGLIGFCDGIETLRANGYSKEQFISTPLLLDHHLIEILATSQNKTVRCFLDTGSTWNILNSTDIESLDKTILLNKENTIQLRDLQIGSENLSHIEFHKVPLQLAFPIELALGMEFLKKHIIFINFREKLIYFCFKNDANKIN